MGPTCSPALHCPVGRPPSVQDDGLKPTCLLNTWNVATVAKKLNFIIFFTPINLSLNGYVCLVATVLDATALETFAKFGQNRWEADRQVGARSWQLEHRGQNLDIRAQSLLRMGNKMDVMNHGASFRGQQMLIYEPNMAPCLLLCIRFYWTQPWPWSVAPFA